MPKHVVAVVRATYTEQNALEAFFTALFGIGESEVTVSLARRILYEEANGDFAVDPWQVSVQDSPPSEAGMSCYFGPLS